MTAAQGFILHYRKEDCHGEVEAQQDETVHKGKMQADQYCEEHELSGAIAARKVLAGAREGGAGLPGGQADAVGNSVQHGSPGCEGEGGPRP